MLGNVKMALAAIPPQFGLASQCTPENYQNNTWDREGYIYFQMKVRQMKYFKSPLKQLFGLLFMSSLYMIYTGTVNSNF